jgi:predicted signal transduction protein with EAL and GGDEF domain
LIGAIIWILATALPLVTLATITSSIILAVFAIVNLSLAVIQFREANNFSSLPWHFCLPVIGCFLCIGLLRIQSI